MSERPGPLARLDLLFAGATYAHENIADLHFLAPDDRSLQLLRESADILLRQLPALAREVRASEHVWAERELLDPVRAAETLKRIEAEVAAIEPDLRALLRRQSLIARELRENR
jgi:hypothetical protein